LSRNGGALNKTKKELTPGGAFAKRAISDNHEKSETIECVNPETVNLIRDSLAMESLIATEANRKLTRG
jgi:hypothetical protein